MGMKFEYTQVPPPAPYDRGQPGKDHWDADHFITFDRRGAPAIDQWPSVMHPLHHVGRFYGDGCSAPAADTVISLPTWEEDLKDKLIPIVSLAFTTALLEAIKAGSTTLVLTIPSWISVAALVIVLGDIARRHIWQDHPESKLMNIRLFCPTQEIHDGLARYFQGTWEL